MNRRTGFTKRPGLAVCLATALAFPPLLAVGCTSEPELGDFGGACVFDGQCQDDMICPEAILQCTAQCTSAADCASLASGAVCQDGHCFPACSTYVASGQASGDAGASLPNDCPHGAICNNLGFCGRGREWTPPSSGGAGGGGAGGAAGGGSGGTGGAAGGGAGGSAAGSSGTGGTPPADAGTSDAG